MDWFMQFLHFCEEVHVLKSNWKLYRQICEPASITATILLELILFTQHPGQMF